MNKVIIAFIVSMLFAAQLLHAQDTSRIPVDSSARLIVDSVPPKIQDTATKVSADTSRKANDSKWQMKDVTEESHQTAHRDLDTRWFISPLCKFQVQDFGMLEKNHYGYLSNANTLRSQQKSNMSVSLSAYKNITSRISFSADLGISYGHVTNAETLISQTNAKTYNLLNATVYYHLLPANYRLQPYISLGINDIINSVSYPSAPVGVGVKFNSKKIMLMGQAAYGYSVSKNIANTMMYSVGMYLPINSKKHKNLDQDDKEASDKPKNKKDKKDDKDLLADAKKDNSKSDTTASKNGTIVNNIYININMDSLLNAKRGANGSDGQGGVNDHFDPLDLHDFTRGDYKIDSADGRRVIKFVVYFEFNMYSLNSGAFAAIDRVINQIRRNPGLSVEIKGYTDDVGTQEYNIFLSKMRAQMVFDYMNSRGIPSEAMSAHYFGKENPVADNNDPNTSWLNRRAEIVIHKK